MLVIAPLFLCFSSVLLRKSGFGLGLRGIGLETDKSGVVRFSKRCAF
jgi:hypothetical protein